MSRGGRAVYFLRPIGQQGPIKIGCSKEPERRLRTIEIWSPVPLELVATAPGGMEEESILHQMFGESRVHGEWFNWSPRIEKLIAFVNRRGVLPPLDYNLDPYKTRKSAMKRRGSSRLRQSKHDITQRLHRAERRVYGYCGAQYMRPSDIHEIYLSYQGFDSPLPNEEQIARLQEYIDLLAECPPADRSFQSWRDWHLLVTGKAFTPTPSKQEAA